MNILDSATDRTILLSSMDNAEKKRKKHNKSKSKKKDPYLAHGIKEQALIYTVKPIMTSYLKDFPRFKSNNKGQRKSPKPLKPVLGQKQHEVQSGTFEVRNPIDENYTDDINSQLK